MAKARKSYDVWFVSAEKVFRDVPYNVVTDWIQQGRLVPDDQLRPSGTKEWARLGDMPDLAVFLTPDEQEEHVGDVAEALEPVQFEFQWRKRPEEEEEEVDMIPLIDVSLVLLVFFMLTATISTVSRVKVPETTHTLQITENPKAIWIGVDKGEDGNPRFALAVGIGAPKPEDSNLATEAEVMDRFDAKLKDASGEVEVRIAAHEAIMCEVVEGLSAAVEKRRNDGVNIKEIRAEVNERVKK